MLHAAVSVTILINGTFQWVLVLSCRSTTRCCVLSLEFFQIAGWTFFLQPLSPLDFDDRNCKYYPSSNIIAFFRSSKPLLIFMMVKVTSTTTNIIHDQYNTGFILLLKLLWYKMFLKRFSYPISSTRLSIYTTPIYRLMKHEHKTFGLKKRMPILTSLQIAICNILVLVLYTITRTSILVL